MVDLVSEISRGIVFDPLPHEIMSEVGRSI